MPLFKYTALGPDGKEVSGLIEAEDELAAMSKVKVDHQIVLKMTKTSEKAKARIDLNEPLWVSEKTLAMTASQFAILLRSGLPTARTVEVIAQQTSDKLMKRILRETAEDVSAGYSLAQSLETHGKKIPMAFIETVRAGEEAGTLEQSFERLAKYYEKSYKLKNKVRAAMMYPAMLSVLAVIVIAIVITVTVPVMEDIITGGGGELPLPTRILLAISSFCTNWWWLAVALIIAGALGARAYKKTDQGRLQFAILATKIPVMGKITLMNGASQFANTMATLLSAGLPVTHALAVTGKVMDNYAIGLTVVECTEGVEEGRALGDVVAPNAYLPPLLKEMTAVGEESGSLEDTLTTIGVYYDSEVEQATAKALSLLEPVLTGILGVSIGFIVIALYLPMFTMYNFM